MSEYVPIPYPACRYHPTQPAIVVRSEAEALALGPEWVDSPAKVSTATLPTHVGRPDPETPPAPVAPEETPEETPLVKAMRAKRSK